MAETIDAPQDKDANNLTIADLQTITNIIDIAMTRGAFRANEAKTVGETYDKITVFLQNVQAQQGQGGEQQVDPGLPPGDTGTMPEPEGT